MIFVRGGGNKVVVQVHEDCRLVGESAVRQLLEGLGGVLRLKGMKRYSRTSQRG